MFKRLLHPKAAAWAAFVVLVVGIGAGGALAGGFQPVGKYGSNQGCTVTAATSQPFTAWGDSHKYFLAPSGDMENPLAAFGWTLAGSPALVPPSESYDVTGNPNDHLSLNLTKASDSALTPPICVTVHDPELRLFMLNSRVPGSKLDVDCFFTGNDGKQHSMELADLKAGNSWQLTQPVKFHDCIQPGPDGTGQVAFQFAPEDNKGNWLIDDLYIDPIKSQ